MRAVVQRVSSSSVEVAGQVVGAIDAGLMVLLGVGQDDGEKDAQYLAEDLHIHCESADLMLRDGKIWIARNGKAETG